MKTLERIKEEVYATEIWTEHEDLDEVINEVVKRYAKEVAREALKNASDRARFIAEHQFYEETIKAGVDNVGSHLVFIDKQSILDEQNIPKL